MRFIVTVILGVWSAMPGLANANDISTCFSRWSWRVPTYLGVNLENLDQLKALAGKEVLITQVYASPRERRYNTRARPHDTYVTSSPVRFYESSIGRNIEAHFQGTCLSTKLLGVIVGSGGISLDVFDNLRHSIVVDQSLFFGKESYFLIKEKTR